MSALNRHATVQALPDSGVDISVAGNTLLQHLREHAGNLLPSNITPRTVNGTKMHPIGKLPVTLSLGTRHFTDDFHIYPEVSGLLPWKAAKGLNIQPKCYPQPTGMPNPHLVAAISTGKALEIMTEYPSVFDGRIKTMEGEKFQITLTDDAKPFCIHTPRVIPYAFRDKLRTELELLQNQGVIAPVTEPTGWCALIVVTPKRGTNKIRMCVDLSQLNKYVKRGTDPPPKPRPLPTLLQKAQRPSPN